MQEIVQAVFIAALFVVKSESTAIDCEFGKTLLDLARENPIWLDTGDVKGFNHELDDSEVTMCFYHPSLDQCGVDISGYHTWSPCYPQCQQHSKENTEFRVTKYIDGTNKLIAIIVNARMLAPSDTLDKAYVLRVWNETVIYYVRGGHCSDSDSLDMLRPVTWLLENPVENCTLGPTETPSPSPTTSATPSIDSSKQEGTNNPSIQSPGSIAAVFLGVVIIGGVILTALCVLGAGYYFYEVNHRRSINRPRDEHYPEVVVTEEANSNSSSRSDLTSIWQGSRLSKDSGRGGSSSRTSTT